jgi:hypothetical protein
MAFKDKDRAREYRNQWQKENRESRQASSRKYYEKKKKDPKFKMDRTARYRAWAAANPEGNRERGKKYRKANPKRHSIYQIRKNYKVTLAEAEKLFERREKGCEVCNSQTKARIDHDHASGKIRGILCNWCNLVIGHAFDSPITLRALADYLER